MLGTCSTAPDHDEYCADGLWNEVGGLLHELGSFGAGYEEELSRTSRSEVGTCTPSTIGPGRPGHPVVIVLLDVSLWKARSPCLSFVIIRTLHVFELHTRTSF